jgi:hypothetical protein
MDCHRSFWLNRVVNWTLKEAACMSEKKTTIASGESPSERYLVIEARWYQPFFKRFVFVLCDEKLLRERIAGISIVGVGFGSCEAAATNSSSRAADPKDGLEKAPVDCEGDSSGLQSPRQDLRHKVGLSETPRIAGVILQYAVAASVLTFYSKSVLGAALRALVGG